VISVSDVILAFLAAWYWLMFAAACLVVFAGPWLCSRLEDRADARDAELWATMPGATR
jgi:hypothetical protein